MQTNPAELLSTDETTPDQRMLKACVNCLHHVGLTTLRDTSKTFHFCRHPSLEPDLVRGIPGEKPCDMARSVGNLCKPAGLLFSKRAVDSDHLGGAA